VPKAATSETVLALAAGVVLASMIAINSRLAHFSSPLFASWVAHGVGTVAALIAVVAWRRAAPAAAVAASPPGGGRWPRWIYLGGVPGALTVLLAAITVNGPLGFSGTLALMLAGQMLFGVAADRFGWLGLERRAPTAGGLLGLVLVLTGSLVIIAAAG
jgi:transporter family-2 protein